MPDNENINTEVSGTDAGGAGAPPAGDKDSSKLFTQEEVDRIVSERIGRERRKMTDLLSGDNSVRLELQATRDLHAAGYPIELAELVNYADADTYKSSMETIKKVYDLALQKGINQAFKQNGRQPNSPRSAAPVQPDNDQFAAAFRRK